MFFSGLLVPLVGLIGMIVFSTSLFFNSSLAMLWLYLELSGLCLIPMFFSEGFLATFSGLYYYIIFSGVSSGLLLVGVLVPECLYFFLAGFLMKFGVFPLWGWVYRVCSISSWVVVWGLSTILKVSFFLFPLFLVLSDFYVSGVIFFCSLGCLFLSFLFWLYACSWKVCWCHMMLSSSAVLVGLGFSGVSSSSLLMVYLAYLLWASLVILFFFCVGNSLGYEVSSGIVSFIFSFLLLTLPFSLSVFYKVLLCSCIFSSGLFLLICWVVYSISEQVYLFLFVTSFYSNSGFVGVSDYV